MEKARKVLSLALMLVMLLAIAVPGISVVKAVESFNVTLNAGDSFYMPYGMGPDGTVVGLYAGGGYGAHMTFPFEAAVAGTYTLTLHQSFGSAQLIPGKGQTIYLSVYDNGNFVKELAFPITGDWGVFADVAFELDLTAGKHYITFWHENTNSCGGPNVDYLDVKQGDAAIRLEAEEVAAYQNGGMGGQPLGGFYSNRLAAAMFTINNVPADGYYALELTFQNGNPEAGGNDAKLAMLVNGEYVKDTFLPDQDNWGIQATQTEIVYLKAGTNTVRYWRFDMTLPDPLRPDDGGNKAAPNLVSLNVTAHVHTKDEGVVTPPTCENKGFTSYTCTNPACGYKWNADEVPAAHTDVDQNGICDICNKECCEHDYKSTVTHPNCTEQGFTTYTCTKCSNSYNGNFVDANGHSMGDWVVVKPAAVNVAGEEKRECANCDHVETRVIPAKAPGFSTNKGGLEGMFNEFQMSIDASHAGFSGTGVVAGFYCNPGAHLTFTVTVPAAGEYDVVLGYAMGTNEAQGNPGTLAIYVNRNKVGTTTFEPGATWGTYLEKSEKLTLQAGENTITYWAENAFGDPAPNIDYIEISGTRYEAEDAVFPNHMGGSEQLEGFYSNPEAAVQYTISGVTAAGKYALTLTYANGNPEAEDQAAMVALLINGKYVRNLALECTGTWGDYRTYTVVVDLAKGDNNITLWKIDTAKQGANIKSVSVESASANTGDGSMILAAVIAMGLSAAAIVLLKKKGDMTA